MVRHIVRQMRNRVSIVGLKRVTKPDGRRYFYRRVGHKLVRVPPPDDPGFLDAWYAAGLKREGVGIPRKAGTVAALVASYVQSAEWKALKPSTRAVRRRILDKIAEKERDRNVRGLQEDDILADMRGMEPGAAYNRLRVWRVLLEHAKRPPLRWCRENVAHNVERPRWKVQSHQPWFEDQVTKFRERWALDTPQRIAFEIIHWTGARMSDARLLGIRNVHDGCIEFVQQKTGGNCVVPFTAPLPADIAHMEADRQLLLAVVKACGSQTWIATERGGPRSEKAISMWFSAAARAAGLVDHTAHGLRSTRAILLAESGWGPHRIGAWTGHASLSEIEHYTRETRQRRLIFGNRIETVSTEGNQALENTRHFIGDGGLGSRHRPVA